MVQLSFVIWYTSARLRDAVVGLARCQANTIVNWEDICALMANQLIALDKSPGVCPIAIDEILRRVLGKVAALATFTDLKVCRTDQLCSGLQAGMKGVIHAVKELFDLNCDTSWGILLVDAENFQWLYPGLRYYAWQYLS